MGKGGKKKSIRLRWIALLMAIFLLGGCGGKADTPPGSEGKKSPLTISLAGGDYGYPNPFAHYPRGPGIFKMQMIFDSLLERGEKGPIPWLAEKWTISQNGKIYTFTLRPQVKWHDGKPLTGEDVKFSLEYFSKHTPVTDDLNVDGQSIVESVTVQDDRTVVVRVREANATILGRLGNVRMIPKHIWEKVDDPRKFQGTESVIGCGPYRLAEYSKEQGAYKFEAFADYWGPKPKVSTVCFVPVSDGILAFDKGEIDLTAITPDVLAKYENKPEYKVQKNPAFWGYRLIFQMEKRPELKELRVRQAIAYAVDRDEMVTKVARGAAVVASAGYLPVDHVWHNGNVMKYSFDLEKARALLQGDSLSFTLLTGNSEEEVRIAELIRISCGKAGIQVAVKSVDGKTRDDAVRKGNYEMVLTGHGGWGSDPDLLRAAFAAKGKKDLSVTGSGLFGYSNEGINTLAQQQLRAMDLGERKKIIFALQAVIAQEVPQLPLFQTTGYIVYRPGKYDGWRYMFDHHDVTHSKISYLDVQ